MSRQSSWRNQASKPPSRGRETAPRGSQQALPPRRQMEHLASVSRSSGLERDGDTLKDFKVQEEYRDFLQGKVNDFLVRYPRRATESDKEARQRVDSQENVLILFRKLREGISSSRRSDAFALEAYETSLFLATIFESPRQTTSIIPHLIPGLYLSSPTPHKNRLVVILISLLHYLVEEYPSQRAFRHHFDTIPVSFFPRGSNVYLWVGTLAKSLRVQNYAAFERLTQARAISAIFDDVDTLASAFDSLEISSQDSRSLPQKAVYGLVDSLRKRSRMTTWGIIRSAYREFSCTTGETPTWLKRTLCLQSLLPYEIDLEGEQWLEKQSALGHTRQKEDVAGRWIIYKVR